MKSFRMFIEMAELLSDIDRNFKFTSMVTGRQKLSSGRLKLDGYHHFDTHKSGHSIYVKHRGGSKYTYIAHNPKTNQIDLHVDGDVKQHRNGQRTLKIDTLSGRKGSTLKADDLYHHLITKQKHILVGTKHSEGGAKVWSKLASKRGVNIHGMLGKHPVNLDPKDREETHAKWDDNYKDVANTQLVAHAKKVIRKK